MGSTLWSPDVAMMKAIQGAVIFKYEKDNPQAM